MSEDMIETLRKERDEARRQLCYIEAADRSSGENAIPYTEMLPLAIAEEWGWDCFPEGYNKEAMESLLRGLEQARERQFAKPPQLIDLDWEEANANNEIHRRTDGES